MTPRIHRIERTALDEAFHRALVRGLHVDARTEVVERREGALGARVDHRLGRTLAHVLHRGKREPNAAVLDREIHERRVHVRRQDVETDVARLGAVCHQLVGVRLFHGQERCHEEGWIVRLQIARLIRDPCVGGGMRLVEAVPREHLDVVPDLRGLGHCDFVLHTAAHELVFLGRHDRGVLLAHGLAEHVGFAHREARDGCGDLHDLFLVDHDAVGLAQDLFERWMLVRHLGLPVSTFDEVVDHLHRTGPIQSVECGEVAETIGLEAAQNVLHAIRLELEHAVRLAGGEKLVRLLVAVLEQRRIDLLARLRFDHLHAAVDEREC